MLVSRLLPFFTIRTVFIPQIKCLPSWQCIAHTPAHKFRIKFGFYSTDIWLYITCSESAIQMEKVHTQRQNYRKLPGLLALNLIVSHPFTGSEAVLR